MNLDPDIEVYKERYETFRHMDKLRWQMLQIVVGVGSFAVLVLNNTDGKFGPLVAAGIGAIFFLLWYVTKRFNKSIAANGVVLKEFGAKVGDTSIPAPVNDWKSSSRWIEWAILLVSLLCIAYAVNGIF